MKKKSFTAFLAAALCLLTGCSSRQEPAKTPSPAPEVTAAAPAASPTPVSQIAEGRELICLADSREQAAAIAEQYGIELVGFSNGVAAFHTERDPREVIDEGLRNGWTELSINHISELK